MIMGAVRRAALAAFVAFLAALGMLAFPATASAAPGDIGFEGRPFAGLNQPPSADKPESKLWYHDGRWWADMWDDASADYHIMWLNRADNSWVDTGVAVDERMTSSSDALWDGQKLYIATHIFRDTNEASAAGRPSRLYRYSYNTSSRTFSLDAGFPTVINDVSSEALTIDKDSTGKLWATWTQVTGTGPTATAQVYVNSTNGTDGTWGTPMVVPTTGGANPDVAPDDVSAIVSFRGRVGVLWSNQLDQKVYWSMRQDNDVRETWVGRAARTGIAEADDHINIKSLQSDSAGRVFAVVKTSRDTLSSAPPTDPQVRLLTFTPGTDSWTATTFGTLADCHTRPQLVLDETNQRVIVVAVGPTGSGQCTASRSGSIYMKSAPMDNPVFPAGVGTPIMRDADADNLNNVTTTKQSVTAASGAVFVATNMATKRYWHADISLGGTTPPPPPGPAGAKPVGNWETLSANGPTITVGGWALDQDAPTTSIPVHVYVDGGGTAITANQSRPDVGAAFPGAGNAHGFTFSKAVAPGTHTVCVYAIDPAVSSSNTPLGCRSIATQVTLPRANWEGLTATGDTLSVVGWAYDPDSASSASAVHVYVDGRGTALTANGSRPDVGSAFPGVGNNHGFSWSGTVAAGTHQVCVYAIDSEMTYRNTALGCRTINTQLALPRANWEVLSASGSSLTVSGWALDPDWPTTASAVHVYVDGGGTALVANGSRPDVGAAFPGAGNNHGFSWSGSVAPGRHQVCVYAIDVDRSWANTALGCRTIDVQMTPPRANWEVLSVSGSTMTVSGWAFDPDSATTPSQVHVYVDGQGVAVTANGSRPDVGAAFSGVGNNHGFTHSRTVASGSHTVCVYAVDSQIGWMNTPLGCRSFNS
jgi:hypothetical protein